MSDFRTSTHRSKWIFTPEQLIEKYHVANQRALKTVTQYGSTNMQIHMDGSLSYPESHVDANKAEKRSHPKPLKIEDEKFMRVFYEQKIQEACGAF